MKSIGGVSTSGNFGNGKRSGPNKESIGVPGPGQYSIDNPLLKGPRYGFGSSTRSRQGEGKEAIPGPGQYATIDAIGKYGPMPSMKFRP
jgi:hypothetical protein